MTRALLLFISLVALSGAQIKAQTHRSLPPQPATIPSGADGSLALVGEARRSHLLGSADLYDVAVYLPNGADMNGALINPDVSKALRVQVHAPDDLPLRLTFDWRAELLPRMNAAGSTHLRNAFGSLRHGDLLMVEYAPRTGTVVKINKTLVVPTAGHDLMLAFLDHWVGQRPVSEDMRRQLLGLSP